MKVEITQCCAGLQQLQMSIILIPLQFVTNKCSKQLCTITQFHSEYPDAYLQRGYRVRQMNGQVEITYALRNIRRLSMLAMYLSHDFVNNSTNKTHAVTVLQSLAATNERVI